MTKNRNIVLGLEYLSFLNTSDVSIYRGCLKKNLNKLFIRVFRIHMILMEDES